MRHPHLDLADYARTASWQAARLSTEAGHRVDAFDSGGRTVILARWDDTTLSKAVAVDVVEGELVRTFPYPGATESGVDAVVRWLGEGVLR